MTTAFITHDASFEHRLPQGHPEQVARLDAVRHAVEELPLLRLKAPFGARDDILRCHDAEYLSDLERQAPEQGLVALDEDTFLSPGTLEAAYRGVGAIVRAVDVVMVKEAQNAFVATRPPGHHAEHGQAMGFCLFGNVAIGAKYALDHYGLKRVAIVDFDVHHGNGTQDLVEDDSRVLFCSTHQSPLYPWTGRAHELTPEHILNVELDEGTSSSVFRQKYEQEIFPKIEQFSPELLLISAGFDAHQDDPLAGLMLNERDFSWITERLCDLAYTHCSGRLVSVLEGGYDIRALEQSVGAHVRVLEKRGQNE